MRRFLLAICVAFLCVLLTLGLWPFHVAPNDAAWMPSINGLAFHQRGTAYSARYLTLPTDHFSLEVWARPRDEKGWGTLLDLRNEGPGDPIQFTLEQLTADLEIRATTGTPVYWTKKHQIDVLNVLTPKKESFLTIVVGPGRIRIFRDGELVKTAPWFPETNREFLGRLIVGDASGQSDGWDGEVGGVALYAAELSEVQTLRHYSSWNDHGGPQIDPEDKVLALYRLDQRGGRTISPSAGAGPELVMPEAYTVLHKQAFGLMWEEFTGTTGYWVDVANNIVGFIPFGFLVFGYLVGITSRSRAAWLACLIGLCVSLTIESGQLLLPTRESSSTDLCTNTFGTYLGVVIFQRWGALLGRFIPGLSAIMGTK